MLAGAALAGDTLGLTTGPGVGDAHAPTATASTSGAKWLKLLEVTGYLS